MDFDRNEIKKAATLLKNDTIVAFPTETVYGLGANALSGIAIAKIYEVKGRPSFNPLITHVVSTEAAMQFGVFDNAAQQLAAAFWPGPLTLIVPRVKDCPVSLLACSGLDTIALRVPAHPIAQALLAEAEIPIAAPSANRSGRLSPTQASHVREELGEHITMILDGGACEVGIESTVIDVSDDVPTILRPGSITQAMLQTIIKNIRMYKHDGGKLKSPGMMEKHYAPSKPLRLNALDCRIGEALLGFGPNAPKTVQKNLSVHGDLREAAANLFLMLREIDASDANSLAVMPIPNNGLGIAINDRLSRAAK